MNFIFHSKCFGHITKNKTGKFVVHNAVYEILSHAVYNVLN
jgi:hypothetical protein